MENVYEVIEYHGPNYRFHLARESYSIPHIHREIELGMIIEGSMELIISGMHYKLKPGDFWLINTCQSHETCALPRNSACTFLILQMNPDFFNQYYPQFEKYRFDKVLLSEEELGLLPYRFLRYDFMQAALSYFRREERYELICTSRINLLFSHILAHVPYHEIETEEFKTAGFRALRIRRIYQYIEKHCGEKLLLSDIAEKEGLTMTYLSHFFTDNFGMPFQTYLSRVRCKKARNMLRSTDMSLTEISIACGFSAVKYLNKGFEELYCCTPGEYRAFLLSENDDENIDETISEPGLDAAMDALSEDGTSIASPVSGTMDELRSRNQMHTSRRHFRNFTNQECIKKLESFMKQMLTADREISG